jgi:transcription elongation factor GreA
MTTIAVSGCIGPPVSQGGAPRSNVFVPLPTNRCRARCLSTAASLRHLPGTLPRVDEVQLTKDAYDRLRRELDERTTTKRTEISRWIERAREHGDIRENADYDAAKNEQGHNEARVRHIEALLRSAVLVERADASVVAPGTIVEIRMDDDDATTEYLVGSIEERPETIDVLSVSSPLGLALSGAGPGDVVEYAAPRRTFQVEVIRVRPAE